MQGDDAMMKSIEEEGELEADSLGSSAGDEPKKKRRSPSKVWKKPKDMPKRPLSAYNLFFRDERNRMMISAGPGVEGSVAVSPGGKRKHIRVSGLGFATLAKEIAGKWKQLSPEEKKPYEKIAAEDKRKYDIAVAKWRVLQKEKQGHGKSDSSIGDEGQGPVGHPYPHGLNYPTDWFEASFNTTTTAGLSFNDDYSMRSGNAVQGEGFGPTFGHSPGVHNVSVPQRPFDGVSPFGYHQSPLDLARSAHFASQIQSMRNSVPTLPFNSFGEPTQDSSPAQHVPVAGWYQDQQMAQPSFDQSIGELMPPSDPHETHYQRSRSLPLAAYSGSGLAHQQTPHPEWELQRSLSFQAGQSLESHLQNPVQSNYDHSAHLYQNLQENPSDGVYEHSTLQQETNQQRFNPTTFQSHPSAQEHHHTHQQSSQPGSQTYPLDEDTINFLTSLEFPKRHHQP